MRKIKDMPKTERPREKLEKYGPGRLSDAELLAIVLRTGTRDLSVTALSRKLLLKFKDNDISEVNVAELKKEYGIGIAKACEIIAVFELGKRKFLGKKSSVLLSPREVWERTEDIRNSKREHFLVFYLDSRNQEIKRETVSIGTLDASLVHPREVFESAIKNNAASVIVAHNHPSGDMSPSSEDVEITKRLVHAGKILGIPVIDHIIVTGGIDGFRSIISD